MQYATSVEMKLEEITKPTDGKHYKYAGISFKVRLYYTAIALHYRNAHSFNDIALRYCIAVSHES